MGKATTLAVLALYCSSLVTYASCSLPHPAKDCFGLISSLASHDPFLCNRRHFAAKLFSSEELSAGRYVRAMLTPEYFNETYSCGDTRFWIDEIYRGSANQFEELRESSPLGYGTNAGYYDILNYGPRALTSLARNYSDLDKHAVLFKFQTNGVADHVWMVVQTPGPNYRDINGLYSFNPPGHMRYWDEAFAVLKDHFGAYISNGSLDLPPSLPYEKVLEEYFQFVRDYDQASIESNLRRSWEYFGQGRLLSQATFEANYFAPLQALMWQVRLMAEGKARPLWTQTLQDIWIYHFGSPNPLFYPGLPFDYMTSPIGLRGFELQVRVDLVSLVDNECETNYANVGSSIPGWKSQTVSVAVSPDSKRYMVLVSLSFNVLSLFNVRF
ncbi:unnamed protein product [Sphagnum tenellum]